MDGEFAQQQQQAQHLRVVEALLFAAQTPLPTRELAERLPEDADIEALLAELQARYENRGVVLRRIGDGWAFRTAPDLAEKLSVTLEKPHKPGRAALETLAIIAYHQPVTRAEIEDIRGVAVGRGALDFLLQAGWIRPCGRRRLPGRPMTWGTTPGFLDHFGLESLDALPGVDELRAAGLMDPMPSGGALISERAPENDAGEDGYDDDENDFVDDVADEDENTENGETC